MRLHPYEYLFFNSMVGGLEGASRRYETDYWVNVMPAAVKELEHFIDSTDIRTDPTHRTPYLVAVCGERVSFENEAEPRLKFTADWNRADFYIAPTHMDCDRVLRGKVVSVIKRVRDSDRRGEGSARNKRSGAVGPGRDCAHPSDNPDHGRPHG